MSNLKQNQIFEQIELVKYLIARNSPFLHNLQVVFEQAEKLLGNRIPTIFPNYTLHDINHSIRVADYMYTIIKNKIEQLSELDIVILLYCAILHDIGMVVHETELDAIKSDNYRDINGDKLDVQLSNIKRLRWIQNIKDEDKQILVAIQEYVRQTHGTRARIFIERLHSSYNADNSLFSLPLLPSANFHKELGLICKSHTENTIWIKENIKDIQTKDKYTYSPQFCACILRLADIMDIDERRTPTILEESINPRARSKEEWLQHRVIQNIEKIKHENNRLTFYFEGECNDSKIHRKIYNYLDWVKNELVGCNSIFKNLSNNYQLDLDINIKRNIKAVGNYDIPDNKISMDYRAVSTLLMGERIYGDKKYGLRELLQNSLDACRVRTEIEKRRQKAWTNAYKPMIALIFNEEEDTVTIKDNGIGMTLNIINNNFLSIGKSYYQSDSYIMQGLKYKPIGTFGIGFLAGFMLSEDIKIKTKDIEASHPHVIYLEKGEEYSSIEHIEENGFDGTEIILNYLQFMEVFTSVNSVKEFIQEQIKTADIEVNIFTVINSETELISIDTKLKLDYPNAIIINISKYLNGIEGFIALENNKLIYESIGDLEIDDAGCFIYDKGVLVNSKKAIDNLIISKISKNNILEYLIATTEDTIDNEFYQYYVFYDNNSEDIENIKNATKNYILNLVRKRGLSNPSVELEIYQMYFFNNAGEHHYSIPYYSEHQESSNMPTIDDYVYSPLGNFNHHEFYLHSIYNNGIFVKNEEYYFNDQFYIPYSSLNILDYSLNIQDQLALDISRHSFSRREEIDEIYSTIIKAAHIAVYHDFKLNTCEREMLKDFINKSYPLPSKYIK